MARNIIERLTEEYIDGIVSFVESARKFYVQPIMASEELLDLTKRMQLLYGVGLLGEADLTMSLDHLARSFSGETIIWCAAPFKVESENGGEDYPTYYYRATVVSRCGPSKVKVFFVDYGNTSVVPIANLKVLPQTYQELAMMAVPCRLIEGEKGGDTHAINTENFRSIVDGFHVVIHRSSDCPHKKDAAVAKSPKPELAEPMYVSVFITDGKEEENVGEILLSGLTNGVQSR